ncbi:MAG: hypothetical protein B9S32_03890 [Verrucomicrobia bacterium Tous-C9LFEB]|nr:MAG: hypothetical protein B9S32_03890 [Verrucomicrobia bacterium Tous-C9LFEB]
MAILVTCGPSFEPIDQVRRLTNFSTGELGVRLAEALAAAGHDVICLKGVGATFRDPAKSVRQIAFATNDDLQRELETLSRQEKIGAVFHTAALCDFKVVTATSSSGARLDAAKIPSRIDSITLVLEPALKVISGLRPLFPGARIVGWKYELVGKQSDAVEKAQRQIKENHIKACVVNGDAYGDGYGFCTAQGVQHHSTTKAELCAFLVEWLKKA